MEASEPKKRKGHRQKGAGTIIHDKPAITTSEGVTLRSFERLPSQLLVEYCQKNGRSKPQYSQQSPSQRSKFKMKVLLPDEKNPRKTFQFCPEQDFDSLSLAKENVSLLALAHFNRNIPYESKLPEPYRTLWIAVSSSSSCTLPAPPPTSTSAPTKSLSSSSGVSVLSNKTKFASQAEEDKHNLAVAQESRALQEQQQASRQSANIPVIVLPPQLLNEMDRICLLQIPSSSLPSSQISSHQSTSSEVQQSSSSSWFTTPLSKSKNYFPPNSSSSSFSSQLPISSSKSSFLSLIHDNNTEIIIIHGETGSGKTTQIPQYLLQDKNFHCKIIVTQPRRLACLAVSNRIAKEIGESGAGETVGYMIRGNSSYHRSLTRCMLVTLGVFLNVVRDCWTDVASSIDYVVIDEVHERSCDVDLVLMLIRKLMQCALNSNRKLKLILMSATIDTSNFRNYFESKGLNVSVLEVSGRCFQVRQVYVDQQEILTEFRPNSKRNDDDDDRERSSMLASYLARKKSNVIDTDPTLNESMEMIPRLIFDVINSNDNNNDDGRPYSVLVFLPGVGEISNVDRRINEILRKMWTIDDDYNEDENDEVDVTASRITGYSTPLKHHTIGIFQLHGQQSVAQQDCIFSSPHHISIILATNIAETSLTIPHVSVVIDSCLERNMFYNAESDTRELRLMYCSKNSLRQRCGRAGRVREGVCFRMVPRSWIDGGDGVISDDANVEIVRVSLEDVSLELLSLIHSRLSQVDPDMSLIGMLNECLSPPPFENISTAIKSLVSLGAISSSSTNNNHELTILGQFMSRLLPCTTGNARVSKMLLYGLILGCGEMIILLSSLLTSSSFSSISKSTMQMSEQTKLRLVSCTGTRSDVAAYLWILIECLTVLKPPHNNNDDEADKLNWNKRNMSRVEQICSSYEMSMDLILEVLRSYQHICQTISHDNTISQLSRFLGLDGKNTNGFDFLAAWRVCRSCMCVGTLKNIIKVVAPPTKFVETIYGALMRQVNANELKLMIQTSQGDDEDDNDTANVKMSRVRIHPSSILSSSSNYSSPYLIFLSKTKIQKIFVNFVSELFPMCLLLFSGFRCGVYNMSGNSITIKVVYDEVDVDCDDNGWIEATVAPSAKHCHIESKIVQIRNIFNSAINSLLLSLQDRQQSHGSRNQSVVSVLQFVKNCVQQESMG